MQAPQSKPSEAPAPQPAPLHPFMVQIDRPQERETLKDVIVGSFGLTGALVLAALVSGTTLAAIWILWRKWRRTYEHDAPPSLGPVPLGPDSPTRPPSSQDQ